MLKKRIIARLDVKAPNLITPVHMEGQRQAGDPAEFAERYDDQGVDEIIYVDTVASLYGRNNLLDLVSHTAERVFCPLTVAGGIRSIDDARALLRAGADKVAVNTAAVAYPKLITDLARVLGAQAVVLQVDARRIDGQHEIFVDGGRQRVGMAAVEWAEEGVRHGAGEVLLTSIDRQGTGEGCDCELISAVTDAVSVPVVASGGVLEPEDAVAAFRAGADGIAAAYTFHSGPTAPSDVRTAMWQAGLAVRRIPEWVQQA